LLDAFDGGFHELTRCDLTFGHEFGLGRGVEPAGVLRE